MNLDKEIDDIMTKMSAGRVYSWAETLHVKYGIFCPLADLRKMVAEAWKNVGMDKCDKCASPDIYKSWEGTRLCQDCYEDLKAEAQQQTIPWQIGDES